MDKVNENESLPAILIYYYYYILYHRVLSVVYV